MRSELIFNGQPFSAFDAYVATSNFLDGAAKDYTSVSVLGRSGDLQISNNRYKNITVKVRVYVRSNMEQNIRAMRSYLESVNGYARLELSDQPNEYRIGLYKEMFIPSSYDVNVGVVDLTFDCKPQRFLKSGEIPVSASSQSVSYTGNPVEIDNPSGLSAVNSLSVALNPTQDGTGDPSPTNIRPIYGTEEVTVTQTGKNLHGGMDLANAVKASMPSATIDTEAKTVSYAATATTTQPIVKGIFKENTRYTIMWTYAKTGTDTGSNLRVYYTNGTYDIFPTHNDGTTPVMHVLVTDEGKTVSNISKSNNGGTTVIYYDECGIFEGVLTEDDFVPYDGQTVTIDLDGTVYGGTLNVTTGVLTVDKVAVDMGSLTWTRNENASLVGGGNYQATITGRKLGVIYGYMICERYAVLSARGASNIPSGTDSAIFTNTSASTNIIYVIDSTVSTAADFKTAVTGTKLVYTLATPQTIQLTAQQISLLTGVNYISSSDEVTVTVTEPSLLENPTLFESKPLIRVYGNGVLTINNQYITIAENPYEYIDIDCDMMDCYYNSNNANQYVTFSTNDYITLKSGANYVAYDGTVQITPRWYEV